MVSLKNKLLATQLLLQLCLLGIFCMALYLYCQRIFESQLRQDLESELSEIQDQLKWQEGEDGISFQFEGSVDSSLLYEIRTKDGILIFSSTPSLPEEAHQLDGDYEILPTDSQEPLQILRTSIQEDTPFNGWKIITGKSRKQVIDAKSIILKGSIVCGTLLVLANLLIMFLNIRSVLKPLNHIGSKVEMLDVKQLKNKFQPEIYPPELADIARKLNEMIERISQTVHRESRFASAAAHELRTPIAELRSITEVGLIEHDTNSPNSGNREFFVDALAVVHRMQRLMDSLLAMSRQESNHEFTLERLNVYEFIAKHLKEEEHCQFPSPPLFAEADTALLSAVITNLLHNSRVYGDAPVTLIGQNNWVEFQNPCSSLSQDEIEKVTEPFWTKNQARTSGKGTGLGLSVVQHYCELMNWDFTVRLEDGLFIARIEF